MGRRVDRMLKYRISINVALDRACGPELYHFPPKFSLELEMKSMRKRTLIMPQPVVELIYSRPIDRTASTNRSPRGLRCS